VIGTLHIVLAMKPLEGNFTQNALRHGVAGINVDGCRVASEGGSPSISRRESAVRTGTVSTRPGTYNRPLQDRTSAERYMEARIGEQLGRFPSNVILEDNEKVKGLFPETKSGVFNQVQRKAQNQKYGQFNGYSDPKQYAGDSGSASRFFKQVKEE
jgi:hypothetical protein